MKRFEKLECIGFIERSTADSWTINEHSIHMKIESFFFNVNASLRHSILYFRICLLSSENFRFSTTLFVHKPSENCIMRLDSF